MSSDYHQPDLTTAKKNRAGGKVFRFAECTCGDKDHHWLDIGTEGKPDWTKVTVLP